MISRQGVVDKFGFSENSVLGKSWKISGVNVDQQTVSDQKYYYPIDLVAVRITPTEQLQEITEEDKVTLRQAVEERYNSADKIVYSEQGIPYECSLKDAVQLTPTETNEGKQAKIHIPCVLVQRPDLPQRPEGAQTAPSQPTTTPTMQTSTGEPGKGKATTEPTLPTPEPKPPAFESSSRPAVERTLLSTGIPSTEGTISAKETTPAVGGIPPVHPLTETPSSKEISPIEQTPQPPREIVTEPAAPAVEGEPNTIGTAAVGGIGQTATETGPSVTEEVGKGKTVEPQEEVTPSKPRRTRMTKRKPVEEFDVGEEEDEEEEEAEVEEEEWKGGGQRGRKATRGRRVAPKRKAAARGAKRRKAAEAEQ